MPPRSLITLLVLAAFTPGDAAAQTWTRPLEPSTGFNDLCGEAIFPQAPNFSFSALHNPDGTDPIPLTPELCDDNPDAVLATWANPDFYAANGFPLPDPRLINVPYNRVPIIVDVTGLRAFVPDHGPDVPQPIPPTHSRPNKPDTVRSFLRVGGRMRLRCLPDGTARIVIRGRGYRPNSVLTIWIVWQNPPESGLPPILPQPLGGAPNTVVADPRGRFTFARALSFCPMEPQNGSVPLAIDVAKHLDGGNTYGGTPEVPLAELSFVDPDTGEIFTSRGAGAGVITVDQGVIPLLLDP
ncbi:MAG: hypothetical protein D6696_10795 [Acidobacteria bacterium]|nr:MAG: hypothetical protein D6696_10795 [Acidobacteriota bacterium]